jgi:CheY-like chemotaxis protein
MLEATSDSRPGVARYLDRIRVAVERGSELTRQIQAFTGHQRWQGHTARPVGIVGETLSLLSHGNTQGLVLRDLCDGGLPPVAMAPGQLQQILMNLGINAIDAMPGGGVLEMGARLEELGDIEFQTLGPGRYVRFWVEDTGLGIPAAHLDRIFEPFYTTKGPDKGTGLGLSVVVGALHAHGGDISVESEEGSGSRFTFLLPVAERELTEVDASASEDDEFVTGNGERLLVVDDDPGMRSYFEELLGGRGFDVLAVSSGYEALALAPARISSLRLMVVDLVMPGMDGVECAIEMTKRNPDLALVLCTGLVQDERLALLPRDRLVGILRKPVSARQLLSKVRLALGVNAR